MRFHVVGCSTPSLPAALTVASLLFGLGGRAGATVCTGTPREQAECYVSLLHLEEHGIASTPEAMVKGLSSDDLTVQRKCLEGLAWVGGEAQYDAVKAICDGDNRDLLGYSFSALNSMAMRISKDRWEWVKQYLVKRIEGLYQSATDPQEKLSWAVSLIGRGGPIHLEPILAGLNAPRRLEGAVWGVHHLVGRQRVEKVRFGRDWVPMLSGILLDPKNGYRVRKVAAETLALIGSASAEKALREALAREPDDNVSLFQHLTRQIQVCKQWQARTEATH